MMRGMAPRRRWLLVLGAALVAVAVIAAVPAIRTPALRGAGWALVVNDPLQPADVIVITADSDGAGTLEAADLVRQGIATRVAVFEDPPDSIDQEFVRRGLPYHNKETQFTADLQLLGVRTIERIPRSVSGTDDEGRVLPAWFAQRGFRSVIVVCTSDHSRRVRRVLDRATKDGGTRVTIRYSRYSRFDPARWWETRDGARTAIVELEKLALDLVRHPIP
jgi:hypothetical protein